MKKAIIFLGLLIYAFLSYGQELAPLAVQERGTRSDRYTLGVSFGVSSFNRVGIDGPFSEDFELSTRTFVEPEVNFRYFFRNFSVKTGVLFGVLGVTLRERDRVVARPQIGTYLGVPIEIGYHFPISPRVYLQPTAGLHFIQFFSIEESMTAQEGTVGSFSINRVNQGPTLPVVNASLGISLHYRFTPEILGFIGAEFNPGSATVVTIQSIAFRGGEEIYQHETTLRNERTVIKAGYYWFF
ncbi:MAG: hypothetical protein LAT68_04355 [Cyclobacteriaceae bacterium]|nr:hypothetical protein [Cyclobacteriaceae bacterium]MCH8515541.1 hypothetical protein [Cyclobacteriaceae bacterium]